MSAAAVAPEAAQEAQSFTCALCHETFSKAWSDEAAEAEYQKTFSEAAKKEAKATVCDNCYKLIQDLGDLFGKYAREPTP